MTTLKSAKTVSGKSVRISTGNGSVMVDGATVVKADYLQTLPGVVIGTDDFRNDIIVRGGSPLENLFIVDNVEIPNINTFANCASAGRTVSILDAALIEDVTFLTGGYPAPFINRVSSVLQIAQREGSRERLTGRITVGFAGAGTILELAQDIRSLSEFKRNTADLLDRLRETGHPLVLTINGKAELVVQRCRGLPGAARSARSHRRDSAGTGGRESRPHQTGAAGLRPAAPQAWHTALRLRAARRSISRS